MGTELFKKYVSSSMIICYRSVLRHPFLVGMVLLLIWMQRLFPLFFSFLVSSSPVIVSTAVLLGTLLSFGKPNFPEIEKEPKSERHEIHKSESNLIIDTEIVGRDVSFASDETNGSKIEVGDRSFEAINPVNDDNSCLEVDKPLYLVDDGEVVTQENCENFGDEHLVEESKNETDEVKVVLGSHYSPLQQSEDEHIVLESDDKLWEGSADPLNSDPALLWKRVEGDGYDDDEDDDDDDDDDDDSGSDVAESSSPDASMADIIPMLDELHPLLSEEHEIRQELGHGDGIKNHEDSEHSLESSDSSSESNDEDDVKSHEDLEVEDGEDGEDEEEEDKESKHTDKEDEPRSAITWTEDDQKNLMNLGTSEIERNRRLENLIARRRARKTMRLQAEKNLIDLESADLPWNIPPISTTRNNPFDYDLNEHIPGSAPSVLLKRRNPFDLPYDSSEEKPDLVGDTFQQEFAGFQPKEPFFRRHESFNVGPSNFGALRSERQETKLRPYFVPERVFQRQFSGISDSKVSSVPDTESVSSDNDLENKDHEDEKSLQPELVSEKDQEREHQELISESHERPYFVPEHVDSVLLSYERQISEVSDSKLSSVSSDVDLENKDHIEDEQILEPELVSEKDQEHEHQELISESHERPYFVPEHVDSVLLSYERQISEVSDSKLSSVSSDVDLENKDHIEDEQSLEQELVSEKDQEHEHQELISESENVSHERPYFVPELVDSAGTSFLSYERQTSEVSESKLSSIPDTESVSSGNDLEHNDHIDLSQEPELISFEDDVNVETFQLVEEEDEAEIRVGNVTNQQDERVDAIQVNLGDEEIHSSGSSLCEVSEQVYSVKEGDDDDDVATSVSETSDYFVEHGNSIETSEIDVTSLSIEESHSKEPVYDTSPRSVTRNLSSSSISNHLQETLVGTSSFSGKDSQETVPKMEFVDSSEADEVGSRSITNDDVNELGLNMGPTVVDDHMHKDESFQQIVDQHQSSSSAPDTVLDMDASHQDEQVEVPSSDSNGRSHEQEEVISQPGEEPLVEDLEELQVQELVTSSTSEAQLTEVVHEENKNTGPTHHQFSEEEEEEEDISQQQKEVPLLDISANETSEDNLESLQIQELGNDMSLSNNSVLNDEPDHVVEAVGIESKKNVGDEIEDVDEFDEDLLVELDAVGDFSVNDLVASTTSNERTQVPHASDHVLETELSADEDSYSKDLGLEQHPQFLEHHLETKHSGDEDSKSSKDLEATLNEMKQDPHDIEAKHSGDEDSFPKDLGFEQHETKDSGDEDSYTEAIGSSSLNEMRRDPQDSGHALETFYSVDEYAFSKIVESTLNDMNQEPHALDHVLENNSSGDEDLYSIDLSKTEAKIDEEEVMNKKESSNTEVAGASEDETVNTKLTNEVGLTQETESNSTSVTMVNHGTENASSSSNTDKE